MWVRRLDDVDTGRRREDAEVSAANATAAAFKRATMRDNDPDSANDTNQIDDENSSEYERLFQNPKFSEDEDTNTDGPFRQCTNREYFLNVETGLTQWVRPYRQKTFSTSDLEIDAFVTVVIHNDILLKW